MSYNKNRWHLIENVIKSDGQSSIVGLVNVNQTNFEIYQKRLR
jgi:hypothetical protein